MAHLMCILLTGRITHKRHENAECLDVKCFAQNSSNQLRHKLATELRVNKLTKEF